MCVACKQTVAGEYYQVRDQIICAQCAAKIEAGKRSAKPAPLLRALIFGTGAAIAGCLLYAIVLSMGVQVGIVALAVGWMVGKAIRYASYGTGGRRQQVLAVALTYFAISTSFLPAGIFLSVKEQIVDKTDPDRPAPTLGGTLHKIAGLKNALPYLLMVCMFSPFLDLANSPASGLLSLIILFVGMRTAWALTAGHEILITGPYPCSPSSP